MPTTPTVATFPRDDVAFAAFVRNALGDLGPDAHDAAALETRLRRWHSRAIVRPQADLAGFGRSSTWYVYRDGRAGIVSEQGWWLADGCAWVAFGRDGTFTASNPAADALVGMDGALVGRHWSDLLPPTARDDDGSWLWALLEDGSTPQSVFDLPLADGRRKVIEYRSSRRADGEGYESYWRELAVIQDRTSAAS
jgi:PAS domain S-box-containing protein